MTRCKLTPDEGGIAVTSPYDSAFVAELKSAIPATERRWKPESKAWVVTPRHGATLQNLCMKHFSELPLLPQLANVQPTITQKIIDVRYIGTTKDRGGDERSAYGWFKDGWNVIFPEPVLRAWFDAPAQPDEQSNLYSVLAVSRSATEEEIKSGYRRMALHWHPDRCKEPNAHEQFLAIQHAYTILSKNRDRYDAGLAFEMSLRNHTDKRKDYDILANGYRSPLRCGLIMCQGTESMGLFHVSKIYAWQDITDQYGRVLVVSWEKGNDHFTEIWC
jgi:hypothetical protein